MKSSSPSGFDPSHRRDCEQCGTEHSVSCQAVTEELPYGVGSDAVILRVAVPVWACSECGFAYTDEDADHIRHNAICRHLDRPTPTQIRALREAHGLSQDQFAKLTRFGSASIKRWELAEQIPSASAAQHLQLLSLPGAMNELLTRNECSLTARKPIFRTEIADRSMRDARLFVLRRVTVTMQRVA
jgi:DNA-binding transcriptional regulator YiaG